jgi:hypothetical protein
MIRYDLICEQGHEFDAWFSDSASYDEQAKRGFVECMHCGSAKVEKQIMAPNIGAKSNRRNELAPHAPQAMMTPPADPRMQAMMQMMREMRSHVEANAENVGDNFAEEARKQHYNETEKRGIYGNATPGDARALIEEGIEVMPLPRLPEDGN